MTNGAAGIRRIEAIHDYVRDLATAFGDTTLGEDLEDLATLGILVDGDGPGRYLLQIFLKDSAGTHGTPEAGPFFYEIIERHGDAGFGAGNFRAPFESIERELRGQT